jgi:flagella basal body P-ring formation protein FlgA
LINSMSTVKEVVVAVVVLLTFGERVQALQNQVHVRHEAQIALSNVELGAIADIVSTNIEDEKVLRHLALGESPKVGHSIEWTAAEISQRLRPFTQALQGVQVQLPDRIVIRRVVGLVTRDALRTQIEEMLQARTLPDSSWEAKLMDIQLQANGLNVPPDGSVQVVPPLTRPKGATSFEIQVIDRGKVVKRIWVNGHVAYFTKVATVLRHIDANSHISEDDVKWQKMDVTFRNDIPAQPADLPAATTRSAVQPGAILMRTHLAREAALKFGEEVQIIAGGESFSVTARGLSQQIGYLGDTVKVKNVATNKILSGVVTAKGVVRVNY